MTDASTERFNFDELFLPVRRRRVRDLPRLIAKAIGLVYRAARREFVLAAFLQIVSGLALAAQLLVGRSLLERLLALDDSGAFRPVLPSLVAVGLATAVVQIANIWRAEQQRVLSELVARYAIMQVIDVATTVPLLTYENPTFHNRLQRAVVNATVRPVQMALGVLGLLSSGFAVVGIGVALFVLQPIFLFLVLLAYAPAWLATTRASKAVYDYTVQQTERDRRREYLQMVLTRKEEAKEVRSFGLTEFLRRHHDRLYAERIAELRTVIRRRLVLGSIGGAATSVLTAITIGVLVWFVSSGRIELAAAGAAAGGVVLLGQRLQGFASSAGSLYESSLFIEDFTSFVELKPAIAAARSTGTPPPSFSELRAEHVDFTYPSRDEPSLRDVSIHVGAGEIVALVGENGSGKTTLAKLLAGLYEPGAGRICWDGADISQFDPDLMRQSVAVIFQDFVRYFLTAGENIAVGRHEWYDDQERVVRAAVDAGAHEYLDSLERGYDTPLGPEYFGGIDLSVGQWQRVALARAFFRDAPFIILDEPTAALDPRAEFELFENIRSLCKGRAVLLISHRFSSVRSADRTYVLRKGRVIEEGSHDELMAAGGLYSELFRMQASAYLDIKP